MDSDSAGVDRTRVLKPPVVKRNTWHHVALVVDGASIAQALAVRSAGKLAATWGAIKQ